MEDLPLGEVEVDGGLVADGDGFGGGGRAAGEDDVSGVSGGGSGQRGIGVPGAVAGSGHLGGEGGGRHGVIADDQACLGFDEHGPQTLAGAGHVGEEERGTGLGDGEYGQYELGGAFHDHGGDGAGPGPLPA